MKRGIAIAALLCIVAIAALVVWYGYEAVADALELAGWLGLVAMILYHALPLALCGVAWRFLVDEPPTSA